VDRFVVSCELVPVQKTPQPPAAEALGVNLYAKQLVDGSDRAKCAFLCNHAVWA
jgi:hypothetical protein